MVVVVIISLLAYAILLIWTDLLLVILISILCIIVSFDLKVADFVRIIAVRIIR